MPGRAKHSKGKHAPQIKKRKGRRSHPNIVSQQQSARPTDEVAALPKNTVTPSTVVATPPLAAVKCPNLLIELRRVGILAGVMLAILLTLVLVLD